MAATRNRAILDKMWSNVSLVYCCPTVLDGVGTSDHKMVLLVPSCFPTLDTGMVQSIVTRHMGNNERAMFTSALSHTRWEYMYTLPTCEEQFNLFQETMDYLLGACFPYKTVSRHSTDKPWITDGFRHLIRQRQRARMSGDMEQARRLRNLVNRTAPKLRHRFCQSKIATLEESSTHDWWNHMKPFLGRSSGSRNEMPGLANKYTGGDLDS